jgi:hypothetical protein
MGYLKYIKAKVMIYFVIRPKNDDGRLFAKSFVNTDPAIFRSRQVDPGIVLNINVMLE